MISGALRDCQSVKNEYRDPFLFFFKYKIIIIISSANVL